MFCEVVVDIKHTNVDRYFDYKVPDEMLPFLERGMRVMIPFKEQTRIGFVMKIKDTSIHATKSIAKILDVFPTLSEISFKMLDHLVSQTIYPYAALIETVIPNELLLTYQKSLKLMDASKIDVNMLDLFNRNGVWHLKPKDIIYKHTIKTWIEKGAVILETKLKQKGTSKETTVYTYNSNHQYHRIEQYQHLLDNLSRSKNYTKKELMDDGFSESSIQTLSKHDVFKKHVQRVYRNPVHAFDLEDQTVTLTNAQKAVYQKVIEQSPDRPYLLYGITGSGKTELYLKWIEDVISRGLKAMILVPEIVLIPMMAKRLKSHFKDQVVIYHSGLSTGEKTDAISQLKDDSTSILLGTRSSIFVPIDRLGIIILDESQDDAYMQHEGVYYDTHELAKLIASHHHIPLIFGSATPRISSMYLAKTGVYNLLTLSERPFLTPLPTIKFIDMKEELKAGNTSMLSSELKEGIASRLSKKEQVLILYNRKGYAPFVMCRSCGHVPTCPHCDISLTYYQDKNHLKCHYCGYEKTYEDTCEICHEKTLKPIGAGIELVESVLKKTFPQAKIFRMDQSQTKTKGSHEIIWHDFKSQKADILLGTQMISKGLDFPNVTLVGILMADMMLKIPSYFASEQTYQLLTQMSGRSGRIRQGETIIQGYDLDHFAIKALEKTYDDFYEKAITNRQLGQYEPFLKVSQMLFEGHGYLETYQIAFLFKKTLQNHGVIIIGPAPAIIKKIKDRYRFTITLKYEKMDMGVITSLIQSHQHKDIFISYIPTLKY